MPGKGGGSILAWSCKNIVEVLYYAEAVKQSIICAKSGKFSELSISEIASAAFSGIILQSLILRLLGLPDLFHCPLCNIRGYVQSYLV